MNCQIQPISAFKDNYIWCFFDKASSKAWVVDPGDAAPVGEFLLANSLKLEGILLTHHHDDHSGGIAQLVKRWGNIPVVAGRNCSKAYITNYVREGDEIACLSLKFKVIEIPGHTLDHVAYFNNDWLFSGDTLFSAGCGRVFEGTPSQMYHSLNKIKALDKKLEVYCGHEYTQQNLMFAQQVEPTNAMIMNKLANVEILNAKKQPTLPGSLAEEWLINPFLRCEQFDVKNSVEQYAKKKLSSAEEVFASLREWKNNFK